MAEKKTPAKPKKTAAASKSKAAPDAAKTGAKAKKTPAKPKRKPASPTDSPADAPEKTTAAASVPAKAAPTRKSVAKPKTDADKAAEAKKAPAVNNSQEVETAVAAASPIADMDSGEEFVGLSNKDFKFSELSAFFQKQYVNLLQLRDSMVSDMRGVAADNLRTHAEDSESHAFGQHQADAGSDAYDRDFALNLLSQEQDAIYEIEEAIKRMEHGKYGVCEMSGKKIPKARLEAIPWARYTVECQTQFEQQNPMGRGGRGGSVFGLTAEDPFGAGGSTSGSEESEDD